MTTLLMILQLMSFDVASIKIAQKITPETARNGTIHFGIFLEGTRLDIGYASLSDLVALALKVKPDQISGPSWMSDQRFDILARLPEVAKREQVPQMMEELLKDRFKLAYHRDFKEQTVLSLVVDKNGVKMETAEGTGLPTPQISPGSEVGQLHVEITRMSMTAFSQMLAQFLHREVIDDTGLQGAYRIAIQVSTDPDDNGAVVRQSLKDLGLRLESSRKVLPYILIDHLEKLPTEN